MATSKYGPAPPLHPTQPFLASQAVMESQGVLMSLYAQDIANANSDLQRMEVAKAYSVPVVESILIPALSMSNPQLAAGLTSLMDKIKGDGHA